jgi:cephalosporin-C deacetylase-like acetyl esterase
LFRKGRLNKDEFYVAEMYLRHRRALDVLGARPEWDGKNLLVRGASLGGCLALACAGLDPNVTAICVGVPAFCDNAGENTLRYFFVDRNDDDATVENVRDTVRYVSVGHFGPEARAEAYFTVGFLDNACHPASVYAAYNAYAGPKRIFNGPVSDHGGIPRSINYDDFTRFMLEHVAPRR